jgi:Acetyltransferase (GNAT) family
MEAMRQARLYRLAKRLPRYGALWARYGLRRGQSILLTRRGRVHQEPTPQPRRQRSRQHASGRFAHRDSAGGASLSYELAVNSGIATADRLRCRRRPLFRACRSYFALADPYPHPFRRQPRRYRPRGPRLFRCRCVCRRRYFLRARLKLHRAVEPRPAVPAAQGEGRDRGGAQSRRWLPTRDARDQGGRHRFGRSPVWLRALCPDLAASRRDPAEATRAQPQPGGTCRRYSKEAFCALANGKVIGSVSLKPLGAHTLQLKQMAMAQARQREGVGSRLLPLPRLGRAAAAVA